jgi:hypothetical protein
LITPGSDGLFAVTSYGATMARFLLAVLIGIGATLAWQTYGNEVRQIVGTWATETVRSRAPSPHVDAPARPTGSGQTSTDDAAVAQPASVLDAAATPPRAAASLDVAQQLEAMARDLAVVRGSIEQLAAKQEQIVQDITTLQAEIGQKLGPPLVPPAIAMPLNANTPVVAPPQAALPPPAPASARRAPSPKR